MNEAENLSPSYIANCVLNAFSSYAAIMLNIVTIHAIRKTHSLPKPLKTLLLSLAVSDLGVGLVAQPFYIALLIKRLQQNNEKMADAEGFTTQTVFHIVIHLFFFASFFGVLAISVDRFLAIHLHLRYQELVTHKRVVAVVISIWLFSVFLSFIKVSESIASSSIIFIIFSLCFICTTFAYCKIYKAVKRHTNQIQTLQIQQDAQNDETTNFARLRKSAVCTFYVYLVFVICYLPVYCTMITKIIVPELNTTVESLKLYSSTLLFLNSSLNPIVYCWKMRHIRHAIMTILHNIIPSRNRQD